MVEVDKYYLKPTALIPNSPYPLLHYKGVLSDIVKSETAVTDVHDVFDRNGWRMQWIFRYGDTQASHYHSRTHECMAILTGTATIRFGVADTDPDLEASTYGGATEDGGVEIDAGPGDVFIIPSGVAHKTHKCRPEAEFVLLTPGNGHGIAADDVKKALSEIQLTGFTMLGAYPIDSGYWDFAEGGHDDGNYETVWAVPKPKRDPVLGDAPEGICGVWS